MKPSRQGGGSGFYSVDKFLVPRLEEYRLNSASDDVDDAVQWLTSRYSEYRRKPQAPFRKLVSRALHHVLSLPSDKPEIVLQVAEDRHLRKRERQQGSDLREMDEDTDDQEDEVDDEEGEDEDMQAAFDSLEEDRLGRAEGEHPKRRDHLNRSLLAAYSKHTESPAQQYGSGTLAAGNPAGLSLPTTSPAEGAADRAGLRAVHNGEGATPTLFFPSPRSNPDSSAARKRAHEDNHPGGMRTAHTKERPVNHRLSKSQKKKLKRERHLQLKESDGTIGNGSAQTSLQPSFRDFGGIEEVLKDIKETILYPLLHPEVYRWLGVQPPKGVLLHGPPGCGKTQLAHAIATEAGVPFFRVSAPEIVSGMSGESEAKIRALFADALAAAPSILFIDEIDAVAPKRESAQREMEKRIVAQFLTCMDDLTLKDRSGVGGDCVIPAEEFELDNSEARHVIVIGATNRPDALDPALRRAGRFDREICLGIPDKEARARILRVLTRSLRMTEELDHMAIAKQTPGYVGADLVALTKEAAASALSRAFAFVENRVEDRQTEGRLDEAVTDHPKSARDPSDPLLEESWRTKLTMDDLRCIGITLQDFELAIAKVQPSSKREGFATIPDVTWDDVGALDEVHEELKFAIVKPAKEPEIFEELGLAVGSGVLLYGPPGCGKTLVAKAIANEAGANFISIKGPELLNKFVGESERAIRQLFGRARASSPCILFFDEMDAMAPRRGNESNGAAERVVNQLLTELDGLEQRRSVFVIAATNRPDMIDPAMLRPGRLDRLLFVPVPAPASRGSILRTLTRKTPIDPSVDIEAIGRDTTCSGFTGADLASLVREACIAALREYESTGVKQKVCSRHFQSALTRVSPSVSPSAQRQYDLLRQKINRTRANLKAEGEDQAS